jgi:hypothetical protein
VSEMEMHKHEGIRYLAPSTPAPIDWPAGLRRAAEVIGHGRVARDLSLAAGWLERQPADVVERFGRALLGEE